MLLSSHYIGVSRKEDGLWITAEFNIFCGTCKRRSKEILTVPVRVGVYIGCKVCKQEKIQLDFQL